MRVTCTWFAIKTCRMVAAIVNVHLPMQALRDNNVPQVDHGIEVLYRFAAFDPFQRSHYFGCAVSSRCICEADASMHRIHPACSQLVAAAQATLCIVV